MTSVFSALLRPVLSYLSATLPPPVYSVIINGLSHCLALFTAICNLASVVLSLKWDAQSLLPPLITLFAAYFALISFYRTTSWMLRTSVFLIKWGTVIGALVAGVGWVVSNTQGNGNGNGVTVLDMASGLGNILHGWIVGGQYGTDTGTRSQTARTRGSFKQKPKPWDSFEQHRKQPKDNSGSEENISAQNVIGDILNSAEKIAKESGWWDLMSAIVERSSASEKGDRQKTIRKTKTKAGSSRSR